MATMRGMHHDLHSHFHYSFKEHPVLKRAFSDPQIDDLIHEDMNAGRTVSGVLISVIAAGLVAGIVAVIAIVLASSM